MEKNDTLKTTSKGKEFLNQKVIEKFLQLKKNCKIESELEKSFIKYKKLPFTGHLHLGWQFFLASITDSLKSILKVGQYTGKKQITKFKDFRRFLVNHEGLIQLLGWFKKDSDLFYVYQHYDISLESYLKDAQISLDWYLDLKIHILDTIMALNKKDLHLASDEVFIYNNRPVIGKLLANDIYDYNENLGISDSFNLLFLNIIKLDPKEENKSPIPSFPDPGDLKVDQIIESTTDHQVKPLPILLMENLKFGKLVCFKMWTTLKNSQKELINLKKIFSNFNELENIEIVGDSQKVFSRLDLKLVELSNEVEFLRRFIPNTELSNCHEALKAYFSRFLKDLAYGL